MKKNDFGMPTLIELPDIEACVSVCRELDLQFIEINMNMPQYQINRLDRTALKKACESGLYFTLHLDENFNIADFNDKVSQAYMDTMRATIEVAKDLNIPVINMHMAEGVHFKLPDEKVYLFERYNDFYMDAMALFKDNCENLLRGSDTKICIENCNGYLPFQKRAIDFLLENECFSLTYDIGHDYCAQNVDGLFITQRNDRLMHMHIHDAKGDKCHLVLGSGEIDIKDKLTLAQSRNCRCVIETKSVSGLKESVAFLRKLS